MRESVHAREEHMGFVPHERIGEAKASGILLAWRSRIPSAVPIALLVPNGGEILQRRTVVHGAGRRMP